MSASQNFTFWRLYGDFEGNGTVNGDDFTKLVSLLGTQTNSSDWYIDYDAAGVIGGDAFTALVSRLGKSISIPSLPSVVVLTAAAPVTTSTTTTTPKKAAVLSPPPVVAPAVKPVSKPKPRHGHGR
jgi:hypothetical protein